MPREAEGLPCNTVEDRQDGSPRRLCACVGMCMAEGEIEAEMKQDKTFLDPGRVGTSKVHQMQQHMLLPTYVKVGSKR